MPRLSSPKLSKARRPNFARKFFLVVAMIIMMPVLFSAYLGAQMYKLPTRAEDAVIFIPMNSSLAKIMSILYEHKAIENELTFSLCYRAAHTVYGKHIIAGEYMVPQSLRPYEVLGLLLSGNVLKRQVTIPEGLSLKQIIEILDDTYGLQGQIAVSNYQEGNVMPDTYQYVYGTHKHAILDRMRNSMQTFLESAWQQRVQPHLLQTPEQALALASIVELEAMVPQERGRIAALYLRRLQIGMRLQADPTVLYAVSRGSNKLPRQLLYSDLQYDSPYNTYRYTGLPPTAIAAPSRDSIIAVLQSSPSEELFFVADGSGGHRFARNYKEHQKNVADYRRLR
ncbi:MAG: endolytic transglycosylase MltG [Proteobacteria bacterium]|nr:endolytic transglycosylase MltG [Pseudomonadota bacterium]